MTIRLQCKLHLNQLFCFHTLKKKKRRHWLIMKVGVRSECSRWLIKLRGNDLYCLLVRGTRLCAAKSLLALYIPAQRMKNPGSSAAIRNYCRCSKWVPKPNLKQGLKRTAGGKSVGRLSWSLSWWLWTPPPSPKHTHTWTNPSNTHTSAASPPSPPHALSLFDVEFGILPNTHKCVYLANFVA